MKFLDEDEELNPILSVVNLVDVFLVLIAALVISIAINPLNPFDSKNVTIVKNAGEPNMEITIKEGKKITQYKSSGQIGNGKGARAGVAYKMDDGSIIYIPDTGKNTGNNQDAQ